MSSKNNLASSKNILAICGSTRAQSSNKRYIEAMAHLGGPTWDVRLFEGLADIPAFNPDLDPPAPVQKFLDHLAWAQGVLICTPEYAMGVPGALKNAIDWTVGVSAFSGKPTALVTASLGGQKGHASLMTFGRAPAGPPPGDRGADHGGNATGYFARAAKDQCRGRDYRCGHPGAGDATGQGL